MQHITINFLSPPLTSSHFDPNIVRSTLLTTTTPLLSECDKYYFRNMTRIWYKFTYVDEKNTASCLQSTRYEC